MSSDSNISLAKSKDSLYKFCPYKVLKVNPIGNHRKGTEGPEPRSGHRIIADASNIYLFGGYNPHREQDEVLTLLSNVLFEELWRFNFASKTWTKLDTNGKIPEELASHGAVMVNNNLLVYGGTGVPFGLSSSNSVHICNLKTLQWTTLDTTGSPPIEQYGQAIAVYNNKLYVVGGTTGFEYSMDVHCLDFETKEWSHLQPFKNFEPDPRYRHEIAIWKDKIFVFGGGTALTSLDFKELPVFNLEDNSWTFAPTVGECPTPRRCHGCVQLGNDVYVSGGRDNDTIFSDIWKLNLQSLIWEKLPWHLPIPICFHSAALTPAGNMYVFGGVVDITNKPRTNDLYSLFLQIPPLADLCWEALLHYTPDMAHLRPQQLLQIGIPVKYVQQIDATCK